MRAGMIMVILSVKPLIASHFPEQPLMRFKRETLNQILVAGPIEGVPQAGSGARSRDSQPQEADRPRRFAESRPILQFS